jgi:hypothetical protein
MVTDDGDSTTVLHSAAGHQADAGVTNYVVETHCINDRLEHFCIPWHVDKFILYPVHVSQPQKEKMSVDLFVNIGICLDNNLIGRSPQNMQTSKHKKLQRQTFSLRSIGLSNCTRIDYRPYEQGTQKI